MTSHLTGQKTEVQRDTLRVWPKFAGLGELAYSHQVFSNSSEDIQTHGRASLVVAVIDISARGPGMLNLLQCEK